MTRKLAGAAAMALAVAACGTNPGDRVYGGAAAGAATGAGVGALGGPVGALAGAGIGGAAGAVTGAATSPQDVNLGRPPWSNPEVRTPVGDGRGTGTATRSRGHASAGGSGSVRGMQEALAARGYSPGPVDGMMGPQTADAVRAFQRAEGMPETGRLDAGTRQALNAGRATPTAGTAQQRDDRGTGTGVTPAPATSGTMMR